LSAMHSPGTRVLARCNSGWGIQFWWPCAKVAMRQHRNRASAQAGFISQLCRGQHSGLRPTFALSSYGSAGHFRAASINE
jgi:hypothetical protein